MFHICLSFDYVNKKNFVSMILLTIQSQFNEANNKILISTLVCEYVSYQSALHTKSADSPVLQDPGRLAAHSSKAD